MLSLCLCQLLLHALPLPLLTATSYFMPPNAMQLSVYSLIVADESAVSSIASKIRTAVEEVEKEAGALSGMQVLNCSLSVIFHRKA